MIINNTGNFVYASKEIDLTDRILFRLEENLLDKKSWDRDNGEEDF